PMSSIVIGLAVILIASFFVTSADSGTFVLAMLTTGGTLNPSTKVKVVWGIILAGIASVLLWSGGLSALQMAMLIAAFPFVILIASFFVTSADSGTFVLAMLTTGGTLNPSTKVKVVCGIILEGIASVLFWSGRLSILQIEMLIEAFPFAILMIFRCWSLLKA